MGEAGRDLLDVMGHQHQGGGVGVSGDVAQPPDQVLAATEVEAGRRLVEQHQLGVGHQRASDLDPLPLALGQRPEPPVGEVGDTEGSEELLGTRRVQLVVAARATSRPPPTTR